MEPNFSDIPEDTAQDNGLTPEKLRQYPGFENMEDAQAVLIINDLVELSRLLYPFKAVPEKYI